MNNIDAGLLLAWIKREAWSIDDFPGGPGSSEDWVLLSELRDAINSGRLNTTPHGDCVEALRLGELDKHIYKVIIALRDLCRLKAIKDSLGKTAEYESEQPIAWQNAFAAILAIDTYSLQSGQQAPLSNARPAQGWMDIETAPKDGTWIDVWVSAHDNGAPAGRWTDISWGVTAWRTPSYHSDGKLGNPIPGNVTHWMPITPAPQADKQ